MNWTAPALNTVLYRFSVPEVTYIITYGRPFSPMSAWGIAGGGPMNDQQISDIIAYLGTIQIPMEGCTHGAYASVEGGRTCRQGDPPTLPSTPRRPSRRRRRRPYSRAVQSLGEALFNLDLNGGAYSCARCHTKGWSYGDPQQSGGGAMGPNLTNGGTVAPVPERG